MIIENQQDQVEIELENNDERLEEGVDEIDEASMVEPFDPTLINITPQQDALGNLIQRIINNEIDMNTDFQRHADLWNPAKMSRLIESILIRFPLPAFTFDATDDENWLIVDGLQRLSTIRKFVLEKEKPLSLKGLEYLTHLEGQTYEELDRTYKRRINECPVTLFLIQKSTPSPVKYSIFRRINTGGLVLNNQEIRNAMAKTSLRENIEKLSRNADLIQLIGNQSRRMYDQELVLRFLAFHEMSYGNSTKNITTFLDEMMEKLKALPPKDLERLENNFALTMKRCLEIFEDRAFEKPRNNSDSRRKRKNSTLFEVWSVALAQLDDIDFSKLAFNRQQVVKKHDELMENDNDYFRSITYSTQKREHFKIRHEKVKQLIEEIINA